MQKILNGGRPLWLKISISLLVAVLAWFGFFSSSLFATAQTSPSDLSVTLLVGSELPLTSRNNEFNVLGETELTFIAQVDPARLPTIASLTIGGQDVVLRPTSKSGEYLAAFSAPTSNSLATLKLDYPDGQRTRDIRLKVVKTGGVFVVGNQLTSIPVENVKMTVFLDQNGQEEVWAPIGYQQNPLESADGSFGWYVQNGTYIVEVEKNGYLSTRQEFTVTSNILSGTIGLRPEEATEQELRSTFGRFTEREDVQTAAQVAVPASTALAVGSTALLALSFNLLGYLQYLFSLPALLMHKARRKAYGVVYNALSKVPIELAIVRIYSAADNKLVKTIVTGKDGRYSLSLRPGQYRLEANKPGFKYPSEYLQGTKDDGQYLDIYTGQILEVRDDASVLAPNIPLDPLQEATGRDVRRVVRKRFTRTLQKISTPSGLVLSVFAFIISPSWLTGSLIVLQTFVLIFVLRLVSQKQVDGKGRVIDSLTNRPVRHAVVRVFETKYNKLVDTVLTDSAGNYAILLGPNQYAVSFFKPGYLETIVKPLDYTNNTGLTPFVADVSLQRE